MSQSYEQVETAVEIVQVETAEENRGVMAERNGGVADRNGGDKVEKIKVKKSTKKHNSKLETMNTERDYEQVVFQDDIPEQDEIMTLIKVDGWNKKKRASKKIVIVDEPKEDIAVANEITIEVAVPLTLEESDRFARVDVVAEPDEVIAVMTEEDCLMAEAEIMMKKAEELKKEAQRRIAEKKLRENVVEIREKVLLPKRNRLERLKEEIQRKQEELAILEIEIEDIEEGQNDYELIEEAIELANRVEKSKVVKAKKVKAEGAKTHTIKKRLPLDEVLEDGDEVFVKSHQHLIALWDNGVFKVMSDDVEDADEEEILSFKNLNQVNLFHHKEILGKANEPNAWKAYALRRADGEVVELDDVFLA